MPEVYQGRQGNLEGKDEVGGKAKGLAPRFVKEGDVIEDSWH
jgi:hypothetical protein